MLLLQLFLRAAGVCCLLALSRRQLIFLPISIFFIPPPMRGFLDLIKLTG
jgi:hypothetical protein